MGCMLIMPLISLNLSHFRSPLSPLSIFRALESSSAPICCWDPAGMLLPVPGWHPVSGTGTFVGKNAAELWLRGTQVRWGKRPEPSSASAFVSWNKRGAAAGCCTWLGHIQRRGKWIEPYGNLLLLLPAARVLVKGYLPRLSRAGYLLPPSSSPFPRYLAQTWLCTNGDSFTAAPLCACCKPLQCKPSRS